MRNRHLSQALLAALLAASMITSSFPIQALAEATDLSADEPLTEVVPVEDEEPINENDPLDNNEQIPQPLDDTTGSEGNPREGEAASETGVDGESVEPADQEVGTVTNDDAVPENARDDSEEPTADELDAIEEDSTNLDADNPLDEAAPADEPLSDTTEEDVEEIEGPVLTGQATAADLKDSRIWIKQTNPNGWGTCTVCSAAMLLRRAAILNGKPDSFWLAITEMSMVNNSNVWLGNDGLRSTFTAYGMSVKQVWTSVTNTSLKNLLDQNPEGIVVYNGTHAALLTDYTGSGSSIKFYCADPAYGDRRLLTEAASNLRVGTITSYWYVSSTVAPLDPDGMNVTTPNSNTVYDIPARYYSLRCKADPTKAVEIKDGSISSGAAAQLNVFARTGTQLFVINPSNISGAYTFRNSATSSGSNAQLLMVKDSSTSNQAAIVQGKTAGLNSQRWYIEKNADGTYSVRNVNSGLYLDIQGGGSANGTVISQWRPTGSTPPTSSRFYLVPANCILWNVTLSNASGTYEYTGSAIDPGVKAWATPTCPNFQLVEGIDYTVSLSNNTNVGTASYRIMEKASNGHETTGTFMIAAAPLSKTTASSVATQLYTGKAIKPKLTLKFNGKTLAEGTDYTLSYSNNVGVGTATITATGKGNFKGTRKVNFTITSKSIPQATVSSIATQKWTGDKIKPSPTVKMGNKTLVKGTDYTLSYKNNVNPGTATIIITGKGDYSGSKSVTFKIGPKTGSWQQSGSRWWYRWDNGTYPASEFVKIDGKTYYFDASGWMITGWKSVSGSWYYFESSGAMVTGWKQISGTWYWFASNGKMATGLKTISGKIYYFSSSGAMVTGWQQVSGKWYYFESSGAAATSKWVGNYWLKADGTMAINDWVDGGKYYVGSDGAWVPGNTR
ncbi:MAG: RICIN domain-containing protein [Coriobacteriales bacterium]|nr:RICIN domain-containing protein [Coriobacteriales bacterium]